MGISMRRAYIPSRHSSRTEGSFPPNWIQFAIGVFLEYAKWFQVQKQLTIRDQFVSALEQCDAQFVASFEDGSQLRAERVVAAAGNGDFLTFRNGPRTLARALARIPATSFDLTRLLESEC